MIYDSFYAHRPIAGTAYWYADQVVFLVHWLQSKWWCRVCVQECISAQNLCYCVYSGWSLSDANVSTRAGPSSVPVLCD